MNGYDCPYCGFFIDNHVPGMELSDGAYADVTCPYCHAKLQMEVRIEVVAEGDKDKKSDEYRKW